ncbi:TetR/AcrR family transcriptional regulator [Sciscionella sediminilitoris]|uniref:TetR/AcrR family transcriptional regulator n=1 Tax=Sciscionella sediminilitoris TaxID=1445613 RepID=UPI0004DFC305|nr:TetR/AcrR family transcriptional regulator [Sciscionella sp. SE31]
MNERVDGRKQRFEHRRGEVLRAATEHALDHGLDELSLRKIAQTVGVSHATLVHHFGTKEQLVAEIVELVLAGTLAVPDLPQDDPDPLRTIWRRATADRGRRYVKLFVAITGQAMHGDEALVNAVAASMRQRTNLLAEGLARNGCPPSRTQAVATALLAGLRGLFVDLVTTGDTDRVDAAFEDMLAELKHRLADWAGRP